MARQENRRIPETLNFMGIPGLKKEAQIRFSEIRPSTLGQAARIPGITPADVAMLAVWLEKLDRESPKASTMDCGSLLPLSSPQPGAGEEGT
jgi:tRNA uridine 5-carboxymethylaminomethyl modification enzyme